MLYANKRFLVSIVKVEEDGELVTVNGTLPVFKGNLIGTDEFGDQFVLTEEHFLNYYFPVQKIEKKQNVKQRSANDWLSIEEAYQQEWVNQDIK